MAAALPQRRPRCRPARRPLRVGRRHRLPQHELHLVVLHRIIAAKGDRFVTKGDNNDFVDPDHPPQRDVVGKLTFRVAHGGRVLHWLHTPFMAALLCGGMGAAALHGRQATAPSARSPSARRRARHAPAEPLSHRARDRQSIYDAHEQTVFTTCAVVALVCLAFGALAFTRPTTKPSADKTPYTEKVSFGYHAKALGRARCTPTAS